MTHSRSQIRSLLDRHGLEPRRALGQNFVADPDLVRRIARLSGACADRPVLEIGAGLGSLTLALAETGAVVTAIEIDRRLVAVLEEVLAGHIASGSVELREADATALDYEDLLAGRLSGSDAWQLVANLPYNIATPLILDLLRGVPQVASMLVMVQLEVAQRLTALPGDKALGIPSLLVACFATAEIVERVPPEAFIPEPAVDSALLSIVRRHAPAADAAVEDMEPLWRTAFSQRRKMLRRSLAPMLRAEDFARAGIDSQRRPQTLALSEWAALAAARKS